MVAFGRLLGTVACLVVAAGCTATVTAQEPVESAVSADDGFDVTDPVLVQSAWWTWAASAPEETNPVSDTTGEHCDRGQQPDVWLVAGTFGGTVTRQCTVPAGVPLAGPVVNFIADTPATCDENARDGDVTLDGEPVAVTEFDAVEITYRAVAGNPVTGEGGEFMGYACGLWFSHPALTPGAHVLTIDGASGDFRVSVTYELTVAGD